MVARCLSLVDARLDEMNDAATGYETQLTSSTLAPFSLSQVSLPTEQELGACPDKHQVSVVKALRLVLLWILLSTRVQMVKVVEEEISTRQEMDRMIA